MVDLLENCSECFQCSLSEFPEVITIVAALAPNTSYSFWFIDKFDNSYTTDAIMSDSAGSVNISPVAEGFPEGWFNRNAGAFEIECKTSAPYYAGNADFHLQGQYWSCIKVTFENNNAPKTVIV